MTQNKSSIRISSSLFIEQTLITVVTLNSQLSSPWQPWKRADPRCAISLVSSSSLVSSLAPISSASSCHHALTLTIAFLSHRAATSPPPRLHRASATSLVRVCLDFPCWCVRLCFAQFSLLVVNLIPFNSIGMLSQFKPTTEQKVWAFQKILRAIVVKTEPVIEPVRSLGHWVIGSTGGSLVEPIDPVSFQVADALDQPFSDGQFDLVWSMESGEHMPDKAKFVSELARVAAPGATIIIVTWCHRDLDPDEESLKP
ncbi:putative tocopherol O-methyltransferase [Arachis hypogaea]|nr:putative tocopherol O-methyltransferase [Arachis hypogaea]